MKGGQMPRGYTVVETMLFLAISGVMFVVAANFMSGRQGKAEFRQSMNSTTSVIRETINNVANGVYDSEVDFTCTASASAPYALTFPPGTPTAKGQNIGCVLMGKVIQFDPSNGLADEGNGFSIFTVAGRQFASGASEFPPTSFGDLNGQQAFQQAITDDEVKQGLTEHKKFQWGNTISKIKDQSLLVNGSMVSSGGCSETDPGAIGIFGTFGEQEGESLASGAQSVVLTCVPYTNLGQTNSAVAGRVKKIENQHVYSKTNFLICFDDQRGNVGSITIGGDKSGQLSVKPRIGDPKCV